MENGIETVARENLAQPCRIANVGFHNLSALGESLDVATLHGGVVKIIEIVDDGKSMSPLDQLLDDMRADETLRLR